ncbi:MAG: hypothetical protein G01um101416_1187 [Microgenomates group bacterium Gr01-1014_16]|nr:MAG: hypothetical protein G01um101416_1187 [Microgenomates group bacterium Gr01-1014_16]
MKQIPTLKLYCFVDETGQDTEGKFFCVVAILTKSEKVDELRQNLINTEIKTKKISSKWGKTNVKVRQNYLQNAISHVKKSSRVYFAVFHNSKEFTALTAFTITQVISLYSKGGKNSWFIIIDGLNSVEQDKTLRIVKNYYINYRKISGKTDQSEPILRLADSFAGLIRDYEEHQSYASKIFNQTLASGCLTQIQK